MARMAVLVAEAQSGEKIDVGGEKGKLERLDLRGEVAVPELIARARQVIPDDEDSPFFAPSMIWDVLPDGTIAYFDSTAYTISLVDSDGRTRGVLERPLPPESVTARIRSAMREHELMELEERKAELAGRLSEFMSADDMEEMHREFREETENREFFPEIPVLRGMRATWDGSLWVQRRGKDPWDDDGPIDVLGPDGGYRGTFAAGEPAMPGAFGPDGLIALLERDELDVPTIVVRRLPAEVR